MNLKRLALRILIALNIVSVPNQNAPFCLNPDFEKEVKKYLVFSIPVIRASEAYVAKDDYVFLDAREEEEYKVSHIDGAIHVGFKDFDLEKVEQLEKDTPIVIYCSIGYRSEIIGDKLKKAGFTSVHNMYGSIFEWVNQHHPLVNEIGLSTNRIHTYNRKWGKWVENEDFEKVH